MDFVKVSKNLEERGFRVHTFAGAEDVAAYLLENIQQTTVGIGGSATVEALNVYDKLVAQNKVVWHWRVENKAAARVEAMQTEVYLTSANALAETGEIINIDGSGNRCASMFFGHQRIYYIIGRNKLTADYDSGVWRARNVAAPKRAQQMKRKTPCAFKADKCYDCKSPERICRGMVTLWGPMSGTQVEVLLVDEDLGL
ncbi:lactate utilization protein [Selenomonas ruminantium]|uniref:Uncharacterized ACR, YkgG family COG1556 n=1 Tax=Selenomonas ruminantium TaxID=971 RepID=A0A1I0Y5G6_SELRU|nr:lactate utilization protein [Selenomonas ruminantium]SFB07393.1 Uncharacterised ACR, YkgG family COG1556 [Selenomonas ruminantium]